MPCDVPEEPLPLRALPNDLTGWNALYMENAQEGRETRSIPEGWHVSNRRNHTLLSPKDDIDTTTWDNLRTAVPAPSVYLPNLSYWSAFSRSDAEKSVVSLFPSSNTMRISIPMSKAYLRALWSYTTHMPPRSAPGSIKAFFSSPRESQLPQSQQRYHLRPRKPVQKLVPPSPIRKTKRSPPSIRLLYNSLPPYSMRPQKLKYPHKRRCGDILIPKYISASDTRAEHLLFRRVRRSSRIAQMTR